MNTEGGQTLIETVVALGIAVIVITAITYTVISSLKNAEFANAQNQAGQYAQQAMEIIRSMKYTNYAQLKDLTGSYCMADTCSEINTITGDACGPKGVQCGQNVGVFVREVDIQQGADATLCSTVGTQISVVVSWSDGQCTNQSNPFCHRVKTTTCISDFDSAPRP